MNADAAFETFEDLNYPGSRHARRPGLIERLVGPPAVPIIWDNRPYSKLIGGQPTELFSIGALALALDRSLVTIRLWTRTGRLPQSTYRLPTRYIDIVNPDGTRDRREQKGRRLYTRAQIEAVVRIASEHGFLHSPRVDWSEHQSFGLEVADAWQQLQ